MRVNIITHQEDWILDKFAEELSKRLSYVVLNKPNSERMDINYYINYSLFKGKTTKIDICFFTHVEDNIPILKNKFFDSAKEADFNVSMSKKYTEVLKKAGINNVVTISPGIDLELFTPKLILGYIGRFYDYTNRKGKDLLDKISKIDWIELRNTEGKIEEKDMPDFYRELDYVIIPSKIEGGPMCLLEGLACGIPLIAPKDVGKVQEFNKGIHHYKNSDYKSLEKVLKKLYKKKKDLRKQVEHLTWDRFAKEHDKIFKKILKNGNKSKN